jgi:endonuclease YncB( thermonuclease family)
MRAPIPSVAALCLALALARPGTSTAEEPLTRVFLNGVPTPVFFNDGDSWRVMSGPLEGTRARLAGYNTLESFGPVHRWGTWHPYELYINAKMATLNARRGVWHCHSDLNRDGYGRILWICPDLAVDQIRKGLAHAMNVDDEPARAEFLAAQREAIANRRGMWAHGVPEMVMTSAHSADEDSTRDWHYNRMVSTRFGHSESIRHRETYPECQMVCAQERAVDNDRADAAAMRLLEYPELNQGLAAFSTVHTAQLAWRWARTHELPAWVPTVLRAPVTLRLQALEAEGAFGPVTTRDSSCFLYVGFNNRYGSRRARCLDEH